MVLSKILIGGGGGETEVPNTPPPKFFNSFLSIVVVQCNCFAHLRNNTVGKTGIDTTGLVHEHLFKDLGYTARAAAHI